MIGSTVHPQTRALHLQHARRYRYAWALMAVIACAALFFGASGYFSDVGWPNLIEAVLHTTYRLALAYAIALVFGVLVALFVGWSPFTDILFPFFDILQNLPSFALLPLFIYFF